MPTNLETIARERYERLVRELDGHHCPSWENLSALMRDHLIFLAAKSEAEPKVRNSD